MDRVNYIAIFEKLKILKKTIINLNKDFNELYSLFNILFNEEIRKIEMDDIIEHNYANSYHSIDLLLRTLNSDNYLRHVDDPNKLHKTLIQDLENLEIYLNGGIISDYYNNEDFIGYLVLISDFIKMSVCHNEKLLKNSERVNLTDLINRVNQTRLNIVDFADDIFNSDDQKRLIVISRILNDGIL